MFWELFVWCIAGNSMNCAKHALLPLAPMCRAVHVQQMCQCKHGTFDHRDMIS